jgi:hypothetical protein
VRNTEYGTVVDTEGVENTDYGNTEGRKHGSRNTEYENTQAYDTYSQFRALTKQDF